MPQPPNARDMSPMSLVDAVLAVRRTHAEQMRTLWAMTPTQRAAAMWRTLQRAAGEPPELTTAQLWAWAQRAPHEVPLIDGEFAFIAAFTPEVAG